MSLDSFGEREGEDDEDNNVDPISWTIGRSPFPALALAAINISPQRVETSKVKIELFSFGWGLDTFEWADEW